MTSFSPAPTNHHSSRFSTPGTINCNKNLINHFDNALASIDTNQVSNLMASSTIDIESVPNNSLTVLSSNENNDTISVKIREIISNNETTQTIPTNDSGDIATWRRRVIRLTQTFLMSK